ncbi:MAG: hypothetical protein IT381_22610 [Deltaproteobacteria bacterium]|nr:hypothetical protein [Deltaproteobacteria bacterium]
MSVILATHLLREQILKPDQVDDLLQLQVVMGGALDTHVLEANVLDEGHLLTALADAYKMPPIGKDEIDDIPQKMPDIFPRVFAETYRMVPYRLIGRNLGVVVAEMPDDTAIMKLEQRLKIRIVPAVTTEARVYYAMQKLYGADIPPRFTTLLGKLDTSKPQKATPAKPATATAAEVAPVAAPAASAPPAAKPEHQEQVFQLERQNLLPERVEAMDLDAAVVKMQLARDRDQIIDVALAFATQAFKFACLFVVQGNSVVGYRGKGDMASVTRLPRVTVPLILQSMFKTVHETHGHYLGSVPQASLNQTILQDLGREQPKIVFLAPLIIAGSFRGLFYCDNGKRGVPSRKVADLLVILTRLGPSFERLIQRRKAEVKVAVNAVGNAAKKVVQLKELTAPEPMPEPSFESMAPALPEQQVIIDEEPALPPRLTPSLDIPVPQARDATDDLEIDTEPESSARDPEPNQAPTSSFEFKNDEPMIAISVGEGSKLIPIDATDLLSQRFLNVLKAAEDDEEEDEHGDEESIDIDGISADALLGKEEAPKPTFHPPPSSVLKPLPSEAPKGPGYKAFAEFDEETDEAQAKGWEDVLVDTIAQGKQGGTAAPAAQTPQEPVTEVGWDDVIVEAAAQAKLHMEAEAKAKLDDFAVLLDAIDSPDADVATRATEQLWQRREELGERFVEALGARFPGRLTVDPFAASTFPNVVELSPVMRLLAALGPHALPIVLPHLESQYPVHRFIATLFFGQVVSGPAFTKLLRRLFDEEPHVREAAAETLRKYSRLPGYDEGVKKIRDRLELPVYEAQVRACEILGRLRDWKSVPLLIPLTGLKRAELANSSLGALMRLTAQDFGNNPKKWTEWWVKNSDAPREQWLVEGLRRKEPLLRVIADEELRTLTGLNYAFDPNGDKRAQEPAVRAWETWWQHEQRHRGIRS